MRFSSHVLGAGLLLALMVSAAALPPASAQTAAAPDLAHEIVPIVVSQIEQRYPFPELARQYSQRLRKALAQGRYKGLTGRELAKAVNEDIQAVHKDRHLGVHYSHPLFVQASAETSGAQTPENAQEQLAERHAANFGFTAVDIDPATSTAYIRSAGPWWPEQDSFTIAAASMEMASQSDNVIIDVRDNPGGSGVVGRFLASYFFEPGDERFYLDGFGRTDAQKVQEWTYAFVPGHRMPKARLFILVNKNTGSASEGFAYAMQQMRRATVVGEPSAGAGIAGELLPLRDDLVVFVPDKMVVAPHTTTGWEGTGVIPDVPAQGRDARAVAQELIASGSGKQ